MTTPRQYREKRQKYIKKKMEELVKILDQYQIENFQDAKTIYDIFTELRKMGSISGNTMNVGPYYLQLYFDIDVVTNIKSIHFNIDGYEPFCIANGEILKNMEDFYEVTKEFSIG